MSEQKLSCPPSFLLAFRDSPSFEIVFPSHSSKIKSPQTPPFMLLDAWAESRVSFVQLVFQPQTEPSRVLCSVSIYFSLVTVPQNECPFWEF